MIDVLRPTATSRPIARLLARRTFENQADVESGLAVLRSEGLLDVVDVTAHHDALIEIAAADLSLARLAEGHTDAHTIAREIGHSLGDGAYGVWAAEPPGAALTATQAKDGFVLSGTKHYASGARIIDRALVTAGPLLFDVDVRATQVRPVDGTWSAVGMADSGSLDVVFDRAPATLVGRPDSYIDRPGFAHGGIRVAAVWLGGAIGAARALEHRLRKKAKVDAHDAASFGRVLSTCQAMREAIAASTTTTHPDLAALHVRRVVEHGVGEVMREIGRAGGSSLMVFDRAHARRVADIAVYVRQHHGDRDDERLGRLLLEESTEGKG